MPPTGHEDASTAGESVPCPRYPLHAAPWLQAIALTLLLAVVVLSAWLFWVFRLNAPFQDDVSDILKFLWRYGQAESWRDQLALVFEPQGNHRTAASRLVYLASSSLQDQVNFTALSSLANLGWLVLAVVYGLLFKSRLGLALAVAVAGLVMLSPQPFMLRHWPMTAFHFFYVSLYGAFSLLLLQRPTPPRLLLAMLAATAASLTGAAGVLVWPAGLAYLLWQLRFAGTARFWQPVLWAAIGALVVALSYVGHGDSTGFPQVAHAGLQHTLHYTLVLSGSALGFGSVALATVGGALLLAAFSWLLWSDRGLKLGPVHFLLLFHFTCAAAVAYGRANYSNLDYALNARYSVISLNLLACTLLLLLSRLHGSKVRGALLAGVAAYGVAAQLVYAPVYQAHMNQRIHAFNRGYYPVFFHDKREITTFVDETVAAGLYVPPPRPQSTHRIFSQNRDK